MKQCNYYDFQEIKAVASCITIAEEAGAFIKNGRCAAIWREGTNQSVEIDREEWHDYVEGTGRSVIDLVARVIFKDITATQQAQEYLGQRYNLTPKNQTKTSGAKQFNDSVLKPAQKKGLTEKARYFYTDASGELKYQVVRYEDHEGKKTFIQCDKNGNPGIKGIERLLYNLQNVSNPENQQIIIVEGEKDADNLNRLGFIATTNSGGAGKWEDSFTQYLTGKDIVIIPDNDEPGEKHAARVAGILNGNAKSIKIVTLPGLGPKGDVTDWLKNGNTTEALKQLIKDEPEATPESIAKLAKENQIEKPRKITAAPPDTTASPIAMAKAGTPYAMTDLGNAERLKTLHRDKIRWDVARKAWRIWDEKRWAIDSSLKVNSLAADTAREIRREALATPPRNGAGPDLGEQLFSHAVKSESRDRMSAMVEVAKSQPGIAISAKELDSDPWLLNVLNGTINLKTGELQPHSRTDLITKLAPVEFKPDATCKRWERFLYDSTGGDADLINFLQTVAGYTLTGDTSEDKLFMVYGPEASGKSTFLDCLQSILGEYARTVASDLLTKKREANAGTATPELAGLAGARLAAASEMEQGREIAEALAKNLTGGDTITARHLYGELFDFKPQFKLVLALNHCPKVSAEDNAMWRRILRIGFEHTVPAERRDKTLKPYLRDPKGGAQAVLAWAVKGCLDWQRNGGLLIPAAVDRSTAAYRQESDPLAAFIEDCLSFNPQAWTPWANIWKAYDEYAEENGTIQRYRVAPKRIQDRLKARDCESELRYKQGRGWLGVEIRGEWNNPPQDTYNADLENLSADGFL